MVTSAMNLGGLPSWLVEMGQIFMSFVTMELIFEISLGAVMVTNFAKDINAGLVEVNAP